MEPASSAASSSVSSSSQSSSEPPAPPATGAPSLNEDQSKLDGLLQKLYAFKVNEEFKGQACPLTEEEIWYVIDRVVIMYKGTPALIEIEAPVTIGGDTHGQFRDVKRLFNKGGYPPKTRYLFLGDYVDRGPFSIETVTLMFILKLRYPSDFYILRGNHETATINYVYGFYRECEMRFTNLLWYHFQTAFDSLPVAGLVSNRIFCMHGGLSPDLHCFSQLRRMLLPFEVPDTGGLVCDLLWSDPCAGIKGYVASTRGVSYKFGDDVVSNFCAKHTIDLIARAHQVVCDGVEFFADQKMITIFSAPAYCNQFDNSAGLLAVNANLACKVLVSHKLLNIIHHSLNSGVFIDGTQKH